MEKELNEYLKNQKKELEELDRCLYEYEDDTERTRNNPYQRDYARVLYSNSFRRLQGKMQLMEINSQVFYRNRLTHSFEVSQIAKSIAEQLSKKCEGLYDQNSMYVIEAGALAHDIGNPPFGHHGERILNGLSNDLPFEGNAQGIRVLRSVEKKNPTYAGLNLSYRTLASIIKYNVPYKNVKTEKFLYEEDFKFFEDKLNQCTLRTLDVQIIDLADEIAYCSHDLEDSLAMNFFTIDEFSHDLKKKLDNNKTFKVFEEWVKQAKKSAEKTKTQDDYSYYFRRELLSIIVNSLIDDIDIVGLSEDFKRVTGTKQEKELGFAELGDLVKAMKKMTFKGVTQSNSIMLYEKLGTNVLSGLFKVYTDNEYNKNGMLLPIEYRWTESSTKSIHRNVLDYLSGMMDEYAIRQYALYFGQSKVDNLYHP